MGSRTAGSELPLGDPIIRPIMRPIIRMIRVLRPRLVDYARLMRLDKPIGALLLLWPMLWALWIAAGGWPDLNVLVVFVVGVWVMRSAGCVMNDFADRDFDPHVARTRDRPLAARRIQPREALVLFVLLGLLALGLVSLMNRLTIMLSFVGLALAATYPFTKRYSYLPQVHLGFAFGWAVPMAFAAQTNRLEPIAWLVMIAAVVWTMVYDTMYAMVDREDDIYVGVKSTAILFGELDRAFVGVFQIMMMITMVIIGDKVGFGHWYNVALMIGAGLFVYQQRLIRDRDPQRCFRAFLNNNWFGLIVFLGIVMDFAR